MCRWSHDFASMIARKLGGAARCCWPITTTVVALGDCFSGNGGIRGGRRSRLRPSLGGRTWRRRGRVASVPAPPPTRTPPSPSTATPQSVAQPLSVSVSARGGKGALGKRPQPLVSRVVRQIPSPPDRGAVRAPHCCGRRWGRRHGCPGGELLAAHPYCQSNQRTKAGVFQSVGGGGEELPLPSADRSTTTSTGLVPVCGHRLRVDPGDGEHGRQAGSRRRCVPAGAHPPSPRIDADSDPAGLGRTTVAACLGGYGKSIVGT
jgi:hypothetical protein